jgi:MFS family permease
VSCKSARINHAARFIFDMKITPIHFAFVLAFINFVGALAGRVLLALDALRLGANPFAVGALAATFSAFPMMFAWIAGRLDDRFGSRWLLMSGAVASSCGLLVPFLVPTLPALYAAAAMLGLGFSFYTVSVQNLVGILGKPEEHAKQFSNFSMVAAVASFVGPMISGFSIDHLGFGTACLILALIALTPVPLLAARGGILPRGKPGAGPAEAVSGMLAAPNVRRVLITSSLVQLGIDLFQFYLPIYGYAIKLSASEIGVILAMFAAASFVVRLIMPRLIARSNEETVLSYAFYIGAASFVFIPLFKSAIALSLIAFLFGLGLGCGPPITMMLTYTQSPKGRSGEALGLRLSANHLARVVGPLLFGSIGAAFGLFPVFWGNALMMVSGGILSRQGAKRRKSPNR